MNVLIDNNVVLDVFLQREPFYASSRLVLLAVEEGDIDGFVPASAVTNIYYVCAKRLKNKLQALEQLKIHFANKLKIAAVDEEIIHSALDMDWVDFEDCVQYAVAESINAKYIVTRDPGGFFLSGITVVSPDGLLDMLSRK